MTEKTGEGTEAGAVPQVSVKLDKRRESAQQESHCGGKRLWDLIFTKSCCDRILPMIFNFYLFFLILKSM